MNMFALIILAAIATSNPAAPATTKLVATSDTYIVWKNTAEKHGHEDMLVTGNGGFALVNFDVSSIPKGSLITGVKLVFTSVEPVKDELIDKTWMLPDHPAHFISAAAMMGHWDEKSVAFHMPSQIIPFCEFAVEGREFTFSGGGLPSLFQAMVDGTYNAGLKYEAHNEHEGFENFRFSSREGANPPYAVVTYTKK